jgi:adenosylcobinamide-GDP ribazoletransferase
VPSYKHPDVVDIPGAVGAAWRDLLIAARFLTCLPIPWRTTVHAAGSPIAKRPTALPVRALAELRRASALFPLVGAMIGAIAGLVLLAAFELGMHPLACAFVAVATMVALSGALHEDGLADFADGLGGHTREQRLAIMRDNRIGTFGTLALLFAVGLRVSILSGLASPNAAALAVIAAATVSRAVLPAVMRWQQPARTDGLAVLVGAPETAQVATAVVLALLILLLAVGLRVGALVVLAAALAALAVATLAQRTLGGQTGDVLGAVQVVAEVWALAAITALE